MFSISSTKNKNKACNLFDEINFLTYILFISMLIRYATLMTSNITTIYFLFSLKKITVCKNFRIKFRIKFFHWNSMQTYAKLSAHFPLKLIISLPFFMYDKNRSYLVFYYAKNV